MMTPDDAPDKDLQKGYLEKPHRFKQFDPEVFIYLKEQVDSQSPQIRSMERGGPICGCGFYWEDFPSDPTARSHSDERDEYFAGCLKEAAGTNLVFLDPDTGPEPDRPRQKDLDKYVSGMKSPEYTTPVTQ